jgi:putative hydrolase of the HAD superfamily
LLIIFDLDDTLVDTSGCITPVKLEHALERMIEAGLVVPSRTEALDLIRRLDQTAESSRQTLSEFLEICDAKERFLDIGLSEIYGNITLDMPLFALDGALGLLQDLKLSHHLALVTIGKPEQQLAKLEKAGIDSTIFSKIVVCDAPKKPHYQALAEEFHFAPSDVVVIGDRVGNDLRPAKELGYKTVQVRSGRGLRSRGSSTDVDFVIGQLGEVRDIISILV